MEWWKELDMKIKILIGIITLCSMLSGFGFTVYSTFAKEEAFQAHVDMYAFEKKKERKRELRQIIYECKTRYGIEYEKAPDEFTIEFCIEAEIELEGLIEE